MIANLLKREPATTVSPSGQASGESADHEALLASLKSMAAGDLSAADGQDAPAFAHLRDIKRMIELRNKSELERTVALAIDASDAMAAAFFVSGDATEAASHAQSIAAAIEELGVAANQIAERGNCALDGTQKTLGAVESSRSSVDAAIGGMDSVKRASEDAGDRLRHLSTAVQDIGSVLETIDAISKQTNLLALNATIEAARAGEAGKGFAVVAGEVKQLAAQTASATEEIQRRIGKINKEMEQMLTAMSETNEAVAASREGIIALGNEVRTVLQTSQSVAGHISETASSVTEQSAAIQDVARSQSFIAQKTEESRQNAERAAESVGRSENRIKEALASLQDADIPDAILDFARADHVLWKTRLAGMLVGKCKLSASELSSHHNCRLGKWYYQIQDSRFQKHPAFRKLEEPHAAVHQHGKAVAEHFAKGDIVAALAEYAKMDTASGEVLRLLDELKTAV